MSLFGITFLLALFVVAISLEDTDHMVCSNRYLFQFALGIPSLWISSRSYLVQMAIQRSWLLSTGLPNKRSSFLLTTLSPPNNSLNYSLFTFSQSMVFRIMSLQIAVRNSFQPFFRLLVKP